MTLREAKIIKQIQTFLFLILVLLLTSCSNNRLINNQIDVQKDSHKIDFLNLINEGKINSSSVRIGESTDELIEQKGKPENSDYLEGGLYFAYGNIIYFTNADYDYDDSNKILHGQIIGIGLPQGEELFGIKLGFNSMEDARSIFGTESLLTSPDDNLDSFLLSESWSYEYKFEKYNLTFTTKTKNGVLDGAFLWANSW
ncbi:hypothetical protein [Cohnella mopanensis]|uniref:hypothetical protein n=1 Tax=Cohnella mopanensis TaxID=2911966 RepID=UPI001EF932C2|nr:hypothetical protein [Cohnella mopanensis]